MKEEFKKYRAKLKEIKHIRKIIWLLIFLFLYILLVIQVKKIETISTFPAVYMNVQDIVGHTKTDLKFEEINIADSKWNNINWLYLWSGTWKTVYYFHGNWGPLSYFYSEIKYIHQELGYNVFAYDYPGYGKSEGFPYKENVDEFSEVFYEHIKKQKNITDSNLIIWWYSVGTAVATDFASKHNFEKIILVSPFASRYEMARDKLWFAIQKLLFLSDSYSSKDKVKTFTRPALIIHGNADKIVPFEQWQMVFESYGWSEELWKKPKKYFIEIDESGHNYILSVYWKSLKYKILDFLENDDPEYQVNFFYLNKKEKLKLDKRAYMLDTVYGSDLESDDSLTKFVNNKISFDDLAYVPENMQPINSDYVYDTKWNGKMRKEASGKFHDMAKEFYDEYWKKLVVVSSYRSYAYQKWIKDRGCPDNLCAKAGYSEHQSWLTIDLFSASTQKEWETNKSYKIIYSWLANNAHYYGFTNTYQKGLEVDGYEIEPWHWRYVWIDLATYLWEKEITFAEFYNTKK